MSEQAEYDAGSIRIRTAVETDSVLLAELGARTFQQAFAADNTAADMATYLAQAFGPAQQAAELADPASRFFIAEVGETAVGYARLCASSPQIGLAGERPAELVRLYVLSDWIGHGVGAALMEVCLATAVAGGHDAIWLGVWEHNARAKAFYARWGFTRFGDHPFQLGTDRQTDFLYGREL